MRNARSRFQTISTRRQRRGIVAWRRAASVLLVFIIASAVASCSNQSGTGSAGTSLRTCAQYNRSDDTSRTLYVRSRMTQLGVAITSNSVDYARGGIDYYCHDNPDQLLANLGPTFYNSTASTAPSTDTSAPATPAAPITTTTSNLRFQGHGITVAITLVLGPVYAQGDSAGISRYINQEHVAATYPCGTNGNGLNLDPTGSTVMGTISLSVTNPTGEEVHLTVDPDRANSFGIGTVCGASDGGASTTPITLRPGTSSQLLFQALSLQDPATYIAEPHIIEIDAELGGPGSGSYGPIPATTPASGDGAVFQVGS